MAITTETITSAVCDLCRENIPTALQSYVDAMTYGASFHMSCISYDMFKVICALGLDDIRIISLDGSFQKFIHSNRAL